MLNNYDEFANLTKTQFSARWKALSPLHRAALKECKDNIWDIYQNGAANGYSGLTYYIDIMKTYKRHKKAFIEALECFADDIDEGDFLSMMGGFGCLKGYKISEIAEGLYNSKSDCAPMVQSAVLWFFAENGAQDFCECDGD